MGDHTPVPVKLIRYEGMIMVDAAGCSACGVKVQFVFDQDNGHLVGLACDRCNTFWPLMLPEEG